MILNDGTTVPAIAYVANAECICPERHPDQEYLGRILRGAEQHGLPSEYVEQIELLAIKLVVVALAEGRTMSIFDRFISSKPPSKDGFAKAVLDGIVRAGEKQAVVYDKDQFAIRTQKRIGTCSTWAMPTPSIVRPQERTVLKFSRNGCGC